MKIKEAIEYLQLFPLDMVVKNGFSRPHSSRWDYSELAVEPAENVTVQSMIDCLQASIGQTFEGYKGGEYEMSEWTQVHIADYGCCGEYLTTSFFKVMDLENTP